MKSIDKIAIGTFILGAALVINQYMPDCIVSNKMDAQAPMEQYQKLVVWSGKCYFIEKD